MRGTLQAHSGVWNADPLVKGTASSEAVPVCKTAGSAYVGSNPTPATTSVPALSAQLRAPARFADRG